MDQYLDAILNDDTHVLGEIYLITNTKTNKQYVGQTMTHRWNHAKYRPFGYVARFKQHISDAKTLHHAYYLPSSIRKHGSEHFKTELLERCPPDQLDALNKNTSSSTIHYILMGII